MMSGSMSHMQMDLNDVRYDAFLANDRTLADPEIVRVERGGRVRLRIINGASSSQFWIDLGELVGHMVATDGHAVHPVAGRRFPLAMAQRLDILIDLPGVGASRFWPGWKARIGKPESSSRHQARKSRGSPTAPTPCHPSTIPLKPGSPRSRRCRRAAPILSARSLLPAQ